MNAEHVAYTFLTNTVHIPPRTRKWNEISVSCARGNTAFFVLLGKPEPLPKGNHPLLGTSNVVADAQIPLAVTGPWIDSNSYFTEVIDVLLEEAGRLIEHLRIRVQEPLLRLRSIQDVSFTGVVSVREGPREIHPDKTKRFDEWFDGVSDTPLPFIDREQWHAFDSDHSSYSQRPPLHSSLLLDAEANRESDPRVGILYAALACEVFIQSFLDAAADRLASTTMSVWLQEAVRGSNPAPIRVLYELGLSMIELPRLSSNGTLNGRFLKLLRARNDLAHLGEIEKIPGGYSPEAAIQTANAVIHWVEVQGRTG